jgi:hypothetical protein
LQKHKHPYELEMDPFPESKRIKVTSHVPPPTMLQVVRADEEIQHATVVEEVNNS